MSLNLVRAADVSGTQPSVGFAVNVGPYSLGVNVHPWGLRLMLVVWHLCWHWRNF